MFAVLLALAALPGLARFRVPALVVPAVVIALIALPDGTLKAGPQGEKVIWEKETEYQYARVLEDTAGRAHPRAQRGAGDPLRLPAR